MILGTAQFGQQYGITNTSGPIEGNKAKQLVEYALANGVKIFDTARAYGNSETELGSALPKNHSASIITKYVIDSDAPALIDQFVQSSLERLKVDSLYGVLIHNADSLKFEYGTNTWDKLKQLKKNGLVKKIGVTVYDPLEISEFSKNYEFDIVQCPANLFDQRIFDENFQRARQKMGAELHLRSLYLQGLIPKPMSKLPERFQAFSDQFSILQNLADRHSLSTIQLCMAFAKKVIADGFGDHWVIGADSDKQIGQTLRNFNTAHPDTINWHEVNSVRCNEPALIDPRKWS